MCFIGSFAQSVPSCCREMIHLIIHLVPHLDCLSPFYNPQSGCQQPPVASIEGEWIQFLFSSLSHENICLQIAESGSRWIHLFSLQSDLKEYQQRLRHDVSARFFSFNVLLMSDKLKIDAPELDPSSFFFVFCRAFAVS